MRRSRSSHISLQHDTPFHRDNCNSLVDTIWMGCNSVAGNPCEHQPLLEHNPTFPNSGKWIRCIGHCCKAYFLQHILSRLRGLLQWDSSSHVLYNKLLMYILSPLHTVAFSVHSYNCWCNITLPMGCILLFVLDGMAFGLLRRRRAGRSTAANILRGLGRNRTLPTPPPQNCRRCRDQCPFSNRFDCLWTFFVLIGLMQYSECYTYSAPYYFFCWQDCPIDA